MSSHTQWGAVMTWQTSRGGPSCRMVTSLHMTSARLRAAEETRMLGPQACRVTGIVSCFLWVSRAPSCWSQSKLMKNSAWMLHPHLCDSVSPLISSHHVTSFPLLVSRCSCGACISATPPPPVCTDRRNTQALVGTFNGCWSGVYESACLSVVKYTAFLSKPLLPLAGKDRGGWLLKDNTGRILFLT